MDPCHVPSLPKEIRDEGQERNGGLNKREQRVKAEKPRLTLRECAKATGLSQEAVLSLPGLRTKQLTPGPVLVTEGELDEAVCRRFVSWAALDEAVREERRELSGED
jgi:hypothetical protein